MSLYPSGTLIHIGSHLPIWYSPMIWLALDRVVLALFLAPSRFAYLPWYSLFWWLDHSLWYSRNDWLAPFAMVHTYGLARPPSLVLSILLARTVVIGTLSSNGSHGKTWHSHHAWLAQSLWYSLRVWLARVTWFSLRDWLAPFRWYSLM